MKFSEAMKALEEGKKVRLKSWKPDNYWTSDFTEIIVNQFHLYGAWEIYTPPKPKKTVTFYECVVVYEDSSQLVWLDKPENIAGCNTHTKTGNEREVDIDT